MKLRLVTTICTIASAMMAAAQVPSLINYQGRLTDASGAPVTGSKNFSISIYDAATEGNLLYNETIGAVTLDANGVYNFQFGSAGTSNTQVTETVATTNGTGTTFQKVLANSPVVAGSVSVTDGTYIWSQSVGSSNEDDFGVAYSTSLRRVTVNYFSGAPAAGRTITATYRYGTSGITGALSSGAEHWMAISVDGTLQATRQRVLAVPFAQRAATANTAEFAEDSFARQQISEFMTSFSSNKILTLGKSLVSSSNFAGGLVQATANQSFGANNLGTKEVAPISGSSTKASRFVVEQLYSNGAQSTYEIQYSNSAPVTGNFVSTGSFQIENPKPNDNVASFRCSIPSGLGGSNISMRIFTPEDCIANFSISPYSSSIKRGAIVVYSSGDNLINTQLVVGFSDGSSVTTTSGVFFDFPGMITNISVRTKSVGMNASISEIKLLH
jgi:hypothetical protein